jgi:hypothetical protein
MFQRFYKFKKLFSKLHQRLYQRKPKLKTKGSFQIQEVDNTWSEPLWVRLNEKSLLSLGVNPAEKGAKWLGFSLRFRS